MNSITGVCPLTYQKLESASKIVETQESESLKEILSQAKKGDVVFVDVDYVLIAPCDKVLRPCGERLVNQWIEENGLKDDPERLNRLISIVMKSREAEIVNPEMVELFNTLLKNEVTVLPLTAIATGKYGLIDCLEDWRIEDVSSFGYQFCRYWESETEIAIHSEHMDCVFKAGFIVSGSQSKGETADRFLEQSRLKFNRVFQIDDNKKHLLSLSAVCQKRNLNYLGIHHTELVSREEVVDTTIATAQLKHLFEKEEWLSEEQIIQQQEKMKMNIQTFVNAAKVFINPRNATTMLKLLSVTPKHDEWKAYIEMSCDYVLKYWPEAQEKMSVKEFEQDYANTLEGRIKEGGRGLFLLMNDQEKIGISNAYIDGTSVNIAEFYVKEEFRGNKYGTEMRELVIAWGKEHNANRLLIEVDKDFEGANKFWSSFDDLSLDNSGDRNIYHKDI